VDNKLIPIILTSIALLLIVAIGVILHQKNPYNNFINTNTAIINTSSTERLNTNTIPIYTSPVISCAKPFNKNYMGWAPISDLRKYGLGYTEDLAPEYEKNPLLFLKVFDDIIIVVHAKVISLGEAYQDSIIPAEYSLRYKILILDIIINKSPLSLNVGEMIDVYYAVYNLEILKQMYLSGTINVTAPKVIENVDPKHFTGFRMPLDVGNEYVLYLSYDPSKPLKIFAGSPYFVFDSKVYSPDNVIYPVDSEPYTKAFYKVCGMPLSDFIKLVRSVNS
jgi:hypothetical protein